MTCVRFCVTVILIIASSAEACWMTLSSRSGSAAFSRQTSRCFSSTPNGNGNGNGNVNANSNSNSNSNSNNNGGNGALINNPRDLQGVVSGPANDYPKRKRRTPHFDAKTLAKLQELERTGELDPRRPLVPNRPQHFDPILLIECV